jgi:hypothetical protein
MSNKNKPVVTKGISTEKPKVPGVVVEPEKYIPRVPKINAGNIEYDIEKIEDVVAKFAGFATELPVKDKKTKAVKPERRIARNIVAKLFPSIKVLIEKNYSKKEMYELFTAQGISINFAGFSSAINKQLKAEAAAEAAKQIALELEEAGEETPELTGEGQEPTAEEQVAEERLAESHNV